MIFTPFVLLSLAIISAVDVVYYHYYKCQLHRQRVCFWENVTHIGHSLLFILFCVLLNLRAQGEWYWIYLVSCGLQFINLTTDTFLEPISRKSIGGVPAGEYRMHGIINCLWGAVIVGVFCETWSYRDLPAGLYWQNLDLPLGMPLFPYIGIVVGIGFLAFETFHVVRLACEKSQ